jgi:hypothetical protein
MRTLEENDELFQKLMKLKTKFTWRGHQLELVGDGIEIITESAFKELRENTTIDFHKFIRYVK